MAQAEIKGVYMIKNMSNNKIYIGISWDVYGRIKRHQSLLRNNKHKNKILQEEYNAYGYNSFIFEIVEICSAMDLSKLEHYYINLYNTEDIDHGYNCNFSLLHKNAKAS